MEEHDGGAVERAQSGDNDAFRLLVERHSRNVFRLAFRMTGNEQDAEDVVQETFLRAYRQLNKYEARSSFATWLFRIASNYSLDLIRSRKRHQDRREVNMNHDEEVDIMQSIPATSPAPESHGFQRSSQRPGKRVAA
jgi:RNA polymerase sigma-70 factor, ECF subfamily